MKKIINTDSAPAAIGPYSQAVQVGQLLFVSGQIPISSGTGVFAGDSIEVQTRQSLENLKAIIEAAGGSMADVVKTTVLLKDIGEFARMNEVYASFFEEEPPARAAFGATALPKSARVEIEAVVYLQR